MKKIMIIGAGLNQLPIIQTAKKQGRYVLVVSPQGDYPGIGIADEWLECDIFDVDRIIEYGRERKIDGVLSDQSDMAAPIVAKIAEKLGLVGYGYENALYFTEKTKMRELYRKLGFNVPDFYKVDTYDEYIYAVNQMGYPFVIKPMDAFASRGISLVRGEYEMQSAYETAMDCSRTKHIIIEKYIKGPQFFSQGFTANEKLRMFAFSDRYYYNLENVFIPYTNAFPAKIDDGLKKDMTNLMNQVIEYLKPSYGHVWAEWIVEEKTGKLYMVEMAIRGGGAYVTSELIPRTYGIDTQEYLVKAALGEDVSDFFTMKLPKEKSAAFFSYLLPEGKVKYIEGLDKITQIPGVVRADIKDIKPGDTIPKIADKTSRYGLIVVQGSNRDELDSIHKKLQAVINIKVDTKEGIKGVIWE